MCMKLQYRNVYINSDEVFLTCSYALQNTYVEKISNKEASLTLERQDI